MRSHCVISLAALLAGLALCVADVPMHAAEHNAVVDLTSIDASVSPCENFYRFACGKWIGQNGLPADRARWSRFDSLAERNVEKLRDILEAAAAAASGERTKIGDYYASCMDEAAIEAKGLDPLRDELDRIAALTDASALPELIAIFMIFSAFAGSL